MPALEIDSPKKCPSARFTYPENAPKGTSGTVFNLPILENQKLFRTYLKQNF